MLKQNIIFFQFHKLETSILIMLTEFKINVYKILLLLLREEKNDTITTKKIIIFNKAYIFYTV
jgi:hypothetical protein